MGACCSSKPHMNRNNPSMIEPKPSDNVNLESNLDDNKERISPGKNIN